MSRISYQLLRTTSRISIPNKAQVRKYTTIETVLNSTIAVNQLLLQNIQSMTHLPWWLTISVSTILLRTTITLPIAIYQQKQYQKYRQLKPLLVSWGNTLKKEYQTAKVNEIGYLFNMQRFIKSEYKTKIQSIYKQYNYSPASIYLLPIIQIPFFVVMSLSLRAICGYPIFDLDLDNFHLQEFSIGGYSWFSNLIAPDPTNILPILIGATHLLNIEVNQLFLKAVVNKNEKYINYVLRGMALVMIPVAIVSPSALSVYWLTSANFSLVQNLLFRNTKVRQLLKIN
ncbi:hypothetical protein K502DRAFT_367780 [Neoconidiobolus thromboides FSU 785]|nr:hypothetical protein K502DRAFT_367780 [Neoconidiobolus thromboides FSU 785]